MSPSEPTPARVCLPRWQQITHVVNSPKSEVNRTPSSLRIIEPTVQTRHHRSQSEEDVTPGQLRLSVPGDHASDISDCNSDLACQQVVVGFEETVGNSLSCLCGNDQPEGPRAGFHRPGDDRAAHEIGPGDHEAIDDGSLDPHLKHYPENLSDRVQNRGKLGYVLRGRHKKSCRGLTPSTPDIDERLSQTTSDDSTLEYPIESPPMADNAFVAESRTVLVR